MNASFVERAEARWNRFDRRRRDLVLDVAAVLTWAGPAVAASLGTSDLWWAGCAVVLLMVRRLVPSAVLLGVTSIHFLMWSGVLPVLICAAYTVGTRARVLPGALAVLGASFAVASAEWEDSDVFESLTSAGFQVLFPALLGAYVRRSHQVAAAYRDRATALQREQELVAEQAVTRERGRMAREMHDVLGHKLSIITLHAGRLELVGPSDDQTAHLLGSTSRAALDDLRQIVGVLDSQPVPRAPQLMTLPELIDSSRRAGVSVKSTVDSGIDALPPDVSGAVHRIAREALTNVHKHAGLVDVVVEFHIEADRSRLLIRNSPPACPPSTRGTGSGRGLGSLARQARELGGRLHWGPTADGGFLVTAAFATEERGGGQ
ncbi:signal transduction histidine kinase [Kibdelosporangium banguiense]|uniref:histidine kinase n=1 Tax=Kibdelosporangium banguiense TaxID=1365924 RepID=A0ABS4TTU4_9PSEU|nr:histidine kinase [Kibdelosporangium banguiense]MBP2327829.1 signal transduction histidine kinase [Kibdelosporangium banguiense]